MTACTQKSYRPTLEALEDRCLPSASPLAVLHQAQEQQTLLQNQMTTLGTAALLLQQTQSTTAAVISQGFADLQAAKWIGIKVPDVWFKGNGLRVNVSNTNLGTVLNGIQTQDLHVWRDANHGTAQGFWVKFEYQYTAKGYTSPWRVIPDWSTSGPSGNEKINVPNGWHPQEIDPSKNQDFKLNIRVTLMDRNNNPVPGEQFQTGAFNVQLFGSKSLTDAATPGQAGQTLTALDQFFAALGHKNHPDGLPIITGGNWGG
ncbi:MAG TPA: hypothetical protein VH592_14175 [Gemmataceae bacterium]|jgi:hypothetical protein